MGSPKRERGFSHSSPRRRSRSRSSASSTSSFERRSPASLSTGAQPTSGLTATIRGATAAERHTAAGRDGREPMRAATARRGPTTRGRTTKAGLRQSTRVTSRPSTATICTCTARSSIRSGSIGRARSCGETPCGSVLVSSSTTGAGMPQCVALWKMKAVDQRDRRGREPRRRPRLDPQFVEIRERRTGT